MARECLAAAERLTEQGLDATVVDPRWLVPVDACLTAEAMSYRLVVSVVDGVPSGGFGDQLARALGSRCRLLFLGLPDREFVPAGERGELLSEYGLDAAGIVAAVEAAWPAI
jgi:1-deoxy-D-xylulose-5-phosphate synthase